MQTPTVLTQLVFAVGLLACGSHRLTPHGSGTIPPPDAPRTPLDLLIDTQADLTSPFGALTYSRFGGFALESTNVFYERNDPGSPEQPKGQTAYYDKDLTQEPLTPYTFRLDGNVLKYQPVGADDSLQLEFVLDQSTWRIDRAFGVSATALHYSVANDEEAFSLLFSIPSDPTYGTRVVVANFIKIHDAVDEPLALPHHYLLGPGIRTNWPGDIAVSLCGPMSDDFAAAVTTSIKLWANGGKIGNRRLTVQRQRLAPPFSDLNVHCARNLATGYFAQPGAYGFAVPVMDRRRHLLVANGMYLQLPESADRTYPDVLRMTAAHEFGHFLGLGHEFDRNPDGSPAHQSVMSDGGTLQPTAYDLDGIAAMYQ